MATIIFTNKCGNYEYNAESVESAVETAKREIREGRATRASVNEGRKVVAVLNRKAFGRVEVAFTK